MDTPPPKPEDESLLDLEMQAPAPPPVPASEEGRLPQSFAEMHIAVVVVDEGLGAALRQAFELRGGKVEVFEDGADLFDEERGEEHFQIVLVCDDVIYNGINYLTRELRLEAWPKVDVLWFFGKQAVEEVDGPEPADDPAESDLPPVPADHAGRPALAAGRRQANHL